MISAEDELRLQRMRGTMLGCALGDAIGLFTEFLPKSQCIQFYGANPKFTFEHPPPPGKTSIHEDRHRSKFARGSWTDGELNLLAFGYDAVLLTGFFFFAQIRTRLF
jgi:ADP-ribosylglycohydrolase